jgi:hypothetical protein
MYRYQKYNGMLNLQVRLFFDIIHHRSGIKKMFTSQFEINRSRPLGSAIGKQDFRRTDFGSRLLAAEGEGGVGSEGEGVEDRCG